jgi:stress response protein YsnF
MSNQPETDRPIAGPPEIISSPGRDQSDELVVQPQSAIAELQVLPLLSEEILVSRRSVETGVVRVATVTRGREVLVDEPVIYERVEVERIPVGRFVDAFPDVREEGDTTIIPVIEEVIVVEKRLRLKEEVHLRRVRVTEQHQELVVVREQDAIITRNKLGVGSSD